MGSISWILHLPSHLLYQITKVMALEGHSSDHQLQALEHDRDTQQDEFPTPPLTLPPADGGWAAWLFLLGSFMIEMFLWGFPFSFGVLQDYYTNHQPISLHSAGVSAVGTTCSVSPVFCSQNNLLTAQGHHVPCSTLLVRCIPALATDLPKKHAVRSCHRHRSYCPIVLCHICLAFDPYPRCPLRNWRRLPILPGLHFHR